MLTPDEIERYKRQLVLKEIGGEGQERLKNAKVLVVGAGGLGSPLLLYLAAAGIGQIGIIDDDDLYVCCGRCYGAIECACFADIMR